jgi:hypothetical protein
MLAEAPRIGRIFVIDTSSVIHVRRLLSQAKRPELDMVYRRLGDLVNDGRLVFPQQVYEELKRGNESAGSMDDPAFERVRANREKGVPDIHLFEVTRRVLEVAPTLLDKDKVSPVDEADPYVVALALALVESGNAVTVITEDRTIGPTRCRCRARAVYSPFQRSRCAHS